MNEQTVYDENEEEQLNIRKYVRTVPRDDRDEDEDADKQLQATKSAQALRKAMAELKEQSSLLHKRHVFYPCSHEGSCEEAHCSCFVQKILCEKTCGCSLSCQRRFRGCKCAKNSRACSSNACQCRELNRECDEDLCGTCGVTEILDPVNRYNDSVVKGKCRNCHIQRNVPRRTLLGRSGVHGFGLFAGENFDRDDYLGEYTGEILSKGESDRRGAIYHHLNTEYLFKLNKGKLKCLGHVYWADCSSRPRGRFYYCRKQVPFHQSRDARRGSKLQPDHEAVQRCPADWYVCAPSDQGWRGNVLRLSVSGIEDQRLPEQK